VPTVDTDKIIAYLRSKGLDPSKVRSCAPSAGQEGHVRGLMGCNVSERCPYHLTRYGGFRGIRPHNVGVYIKPNDGSMRQNCTYMPCFLTIETQLLGRMRAGRDAIEEGKNGELIQIIAQEGQTIRRKNWVRNEAESTRDNWVGKQVIEVIKIPEYQYPTEDSGESFEAQMERERRERDAANPFDRVGPSEMTKEDLEEWGGEPLVLGTPTEEKANK
jgi:hypothetical protein